MDKRRIIALLPSAVTLGNLLCGYLAIINVVEGSLTHAAWWIIIAAVFDLLDGKIARLTGSASLFGVEFDSIADVVSFGAAPAVLFHQHMLADAGNAGYFLAFVFLAAGAIRLARFNTTATTGEKASFHRYAHTLRGRYSCIIRAVLGKCMERGGYFRCCVGAYPGHIGCHA